MAPRRILLIDEQGSCRDALARLLAAEGYEVEVVDRDAAPERLTRVEADAVVYDADLTNDGMRRAVAALEARCKPGRVVALSRDPARGTAERSERGAHRVVLARPINLEELRRVLRGG